MDVLIFNGALERRAEGTSHKIATYFKYRWEAEGVNTTIFNLAEAGIPFFDYTLPAAPHSVCVMTELFRRAKLHIWLTPLYHGGMTGIMKNCLDWLETSSRESAPYLTNKIVGLVCWADGGHAMQGINAMDAVAKALRSWTLPYSIPIVRGNLYDAQGNITAAYQKKFNLMVNLMLS